MNLADLRLSYTMSGLNESEVRPDPIEQFETWFEQARTAGVAEANAMALATASSDGAPSVRMVLLKNFDEIGFVWYTNYKSRKAAEIEANPRASLLFHWPELERQVRICGRVERVSERASDEYFASRPTGHQLGAWASAQSAPLDSRETIERRTVELAAQYGSRPVPRPPHWGGYRLTPSELEFWQGRPHRLHDRIEYRRAGTGWTIRRLSP